MFLRSLLLLIALSIVPATSFAAGLATDVWEFRPTAGDADAGGGFDTASGGTDYSNQDSAQLQLTDLATSGAGVTTLTSATGGFTAAMVGNYIQIRSGTNVEAGFYRVTAHTDTNTVTVDTAPDDGGGGISGGSGDLGGALDILTDSFFDGNSAKIVAGSLIYIKDDGTMTLTGAIATFLDGTAALPITIEGYKTTRGDDPVGGDRPIVALGANGFSFDNFWSMRNIDFTTTSANGVEIDSNCQYINCKVFNSSGTSNRDAFNGAFGPGLYIGNEAISTNGRAIDISTSNADLAYNYIHDSTDGIVLAGGDQVRFIGNTFDTLTTAINGTSMDDILAISNVFYNNTTGVTATSGNSHVYVNNIFDSNTDAIKWNNSGTIVESNYFDYNIWNNNTRDMSWDNGSTEDNASKGGHAVNSDPSFTDAANGDFTVGPSSPALDAGLQPGTDQGLTGDYKWNIGTDQDDNTAGGGGGETSHTFVGS